MLDETVQGPSVVRSIFIRFVVNVNEKIFSECGLNSQLIAAFVFRMACVSFDPDEFRFEAAMEWDVSFPQVWICFVFDVLFLPSPKPSFFNGIYYILRIGIYRNRNTIFFYCLESFNNCEQFHPIVCCKTKSFTQLFFIVAISEDRSVTAGSG